MTHKKRLPTSPVAALAPGVVTFDEHEVSYPAWQRTKDGPRIHPRNCGEDRGSSGLQPLGVSESSFGQVSSVRKRLNRERTERKRAEYK